MPSSIQSRMFTNNLPSNQYGHPSVNALYIAASQQIHNTTGKTSLNPTNDLHTKRNAPGILNQAQSHYSQGPQRSEQHPFPNQQTGPQINQFQGNSSYQQNYLDENAICLNPSSMGNSAANKYGRGNLKNLLLGMQVANSPGGGSVNNPLHQMKTSWNSNQSNHPTIQTVQPSPVPPPSYGNIALNTSHSLLSNGFSSSNLGGSPTLSLSNQYIPNGNNGTNSHEHSSKKLGQKRTLKLVRIY